MRWLFILFFPLLLLSVSSCKKEHSYSCEDLKQAAFDNNTDGTRKIVMSYVSSLSSTRYTAANLNQLAQVISECDIVASVTCFDCIKTLPSQTEMMLVFFYNGTQAQRTIDFSYSVDNEIVVHGVH